MLPQTGKGDPFTMPVIKSDNLQFDEVTADGLKDVTRSNVIGPAQGWPEHTVRVFRLGPGGHSPHHQHGWEHVNYFIGGEGTLTIGDETIKVAAGDHAYVPSNTMHQFKSTADTGLEFICIVPNRGA